VFLNTAAEHCEPSQLEEISRALIAATPPDCKIGGLVWQFHRFVEQLNCEMVSLFHMLIATELCNSLSREGRLPLHTAVEQLKKKTPDCATKVTLMIELLLRIGASPLALDTDLEFSPFHVVVRLGYHDVAQMFIDNVLADTSVPENLDVSLGEDCTLLILAVEHNQLGIAAMLIKAGADPNKNPSKTQPGPLHRAILKRNHAMVCLLLRSGANVEEELTKIAWKSSTMAIYDKVFCQYKKTHRLDPPEQKTLLFAAAAHDNSDDEIVGIQRIDDDKDIDDDLYLVDVQQSTEPPTKTIGDVPCKSVGVPHIAVDQTGLFFVINACGKRLDVALDIFTARERFAAFFDRPAQLICDGMN